ncbi:phospho-sugar mutase [Psychroflexus lacisalsi]|jgi:phosphomannomutase|uniref:Phospho-sugar mutase n=1 Tax=Psychroflexus lacisalsi TaxID=503928 RepID=A0ABN1KC74_9FLAO|nr:phospho-sugar mutase [Psychroflexus lacisalsi]MBZ9620676.1 phospho-sugar mutase [Psychroflexus lacisalsi]
MSNILDKAKAWLTDTFDPDTVNDVRKLIDTDQKALEESFFQNLDFGTGGMRGIMGVGTNRINKYTLGKNTQGISNYMKSVFPNEDLKVVIAYDCRRNSKTFAHQVANVFSANGIQVYIFPELRPTPLLSYSVRHLGCQCGIMLTASHNPPEYNGYKVYWKDGGQLVPPEDKEIISEINALEFTDINFNKNSELIKVLDNSVENTYLEEAVKNVDFNLSDDVKKALNITFTSLHGTSITTVPKLLEKAGYKNLQLVEEQSEPDPDFSTVKSPNPEEPEALEMAIELANKQNSDLAIGTDPDGDRLGIAVRNTENELVLLNGNQTMVLMTWYLLDKMKQNNSLTDSHFIASTIVSTPLMRVLTEAYGVKYMESLTGFKWIAKLIKDNPELDYIGGGEESFGYMVGDFVRDKDANTAILLVCEMAAELKSQGASVYDQLIKIYKDHGFFKENLVSLVKRGLEGAEEIKEKMIQLRNNPPKEIAGERVVLIEDYSNSQAKNLQSHETHPIDIPKSNVLIYYTENGTKVAARPSGTEPKIKFYISVNSNLKDTSEFKTLDKELDSKIETIKKELGLTE